MFSRHPRWHFHKYGMWKFKYETDPGFQYRVCTVCKLVKEHYAG
jgi:hypothetical protein